MKGFLLPIAFLFLVSVPAFATGNECYQEFANVNTPCGGLGTGSYYGWGSQMGYWVNPDNAIDGDWNTYAQPNTWDGLHVRFYVNYTVPAETLHNGSIIMFKVGSPSAEYVYNYSVPDECWNNDGKLTFLVDATHAWNNQPDLAQLFCIDKDGITYKIYGSWGGNRIFRWYEEAMMWNIPPPLPPPPFYVPIILLVIGVGLVLFVWNQVKKEGLGYTEILGIMLTVMIGLAFIAALMGMI